MADPRYMWIWLRANAFPLYNSSLYFRAVIEFEHMFGRKPFPGMRCSEFKDLDEQIAEIADSAVIHWGEGRRNPATIACMFAMLEERLLGAHPVPRQNSWLVDEILVKKNPEQTARG